MAKSDQESFYHKVEMLEDLVQRQQKALQMANNLLDLKDKLVELCEEEVEIYKTENKRLRKSLIISGIIFAVLAVLNLARLLF
jgi:regulator of replication initiation timing